MPSAAVLEAFARQRRDEVVVTTMGATREWSRLPKHPLDFHYLPSSMGQAPLLALGLALAQPQRQIVCFNGDGCMLMNLGCLATIVASQACNYTLLVLVNGRYEVTGGQATAGEVARVDFAGLAQAAGFPTVLEFADLKSWQQEARELLERTGPRFIALHVEPLSQGYELPTLEPIGSRIDAFRRALLTGACQT